MGLQSDSLTLRYLPAQCFQWGSSQPLAVKPREQTGDALNVEISVKKVKKKLPNKLHDADQILIWKAAVALMDGRGVWPRAMKRAIGMIEARDPALHYQYNDVRAFYRKRAQR
jgi:hypothetical protein